jgi:hypothetical protein
LVWALPGVLVALFVLGCVVGIVEEVTDAVLMGVLGEGELRCQVRGVPINASFEHLIIQPLKTDETMPWFIYKQKMARAAGSDKGWRDAMTLFSIVYQKCIDAETVIRMAEKLPKED